MNHHHIKTSYHYGSWIYPKKREGKGEENLADAALPGGALAYVPVASGPSIEDARGSAAFALDEPGAVVRGEYDEGVFLDALM